MNNPEITPEEKQRVLVELLLTMEFLEAGSGVRWIAQKIVPALADPAAEEELQELNSLAKAFLARLSTLPPKSP